ncbi:hypothetical protein [Parafilimonas sp.]|uniref:hypothetical protein n=1 Tax=Parafilimonas sp. TaxID=1969739 RepID=UPI0039E4924B
MTAQYIRLYDFFKQQLHIDEAKTQIFIKGIETIVENKFGREQENFVKNSEMEKLNFKIELFRQEVKTGFAEVRADVKSDINKLIIWIVSTGIAIVGLLLALLKL